MNIRLFFSVVIFLILISLSSCALHPSRLFVRDTNAELVFLTPENHSHIKSPVNVSVYMSGMQQFKTRGKENQEAHIHILINRPIPPLDRVMPHQGNGIFEIESGKSSINLTLPSGTHQLQLIAADKWHRPHFPPLISKRLTIKVTE